MNYCAEKSGPGLGDVACVLTASGEKMSERGKKLSLLHLLSNLQ
jgi:hypothetical protein